MNSEYDMQSLMEKNKSQLQEIVTPVTMAAITEQHWLAVVGVLTSVVESQDNVIKAMREVMTAEQMRMFLNNQVALSEQSKEELRALQEQMATDTSASMREMLSQAEKMNEQFLSMQKEQDEWRRKMHKRLIKAIVISQSALLILSAGLQILLR